MDLLATAIRGEARWPGWHTQIRFFDRTRVTMGTISESLAAAVRHHQSGNLRQAEEIYRQILEASPDHVEAWNCLGIALVEQGRLDEAIPFLERALLLKPDFADAWNNLGILRLKRRDWEDAVACFERALLLKPDFAEACNNLGILRLQQHNRDEAVAWCQRALLLKPDLAEAHNILGNAWREKGMLEDAVASFRRAIEWRPDYANAYNGLAIALTEQGKVDEAVACCQRALLLKPDFIEAYITLGIAWKKKGKLGDAVDCFRRTLELRPDYSEAYNYLGVALAEDGKLHEAAACFQRVVLFKPDCAEACNNLGDLRLRQWNPDEAVAWCQRALLLKPDLAEGHNSLGNAWREKGMLEDAVACYRRALELKRDYAEAYNGLGIALMQQGNLEEASACLERAVLLKGEWADGWVDLGVLRREQGNLDEAIALYRKAIELRPDYAETHFRQAEIWLLQADFEHGWAEYEWRWKTRDFWRRPQSTQPHWDGRPLRGQTILLYDEQGLGDTIQFICYADLVKKQGAKVVVECHDSLVPLFARSAGIDELLPRGSTLPPFDVQCALLSLPGIFKTTLATIPANVPYLSVDPALAQRWREAVSRHAGFKVGIVWQGRRAFPLDRLRSIPLVEFAPLAEVPGVSLISLQKGFGEEQLAALDGRFPVSELGDFDEYSGTDRAAVLLNLDLLITSDTAMAHLAGALGVRVWVALPFVPDWRWLLDREDSPWYPSMRLFRQTSPGDWGGVFQRIKAALGERVAR